jgi:hypothetical protein
MPEPFLPTQAGIGHAPDGQLKKNGRSLGA